MGNHGQWATRTVCGEAIWDKLNGYLNMRGMEAEITKDPRDVLEMVSRIGLSILCQNASLRWKGLVRPGDPCLPRTRSTSSCQT